MLKLLNTVMVGA